MLNLARYVVVLVVFGILNSRTIQVTASEADFLTQRMSVLSADFPPATPILDAMVNAQMQLALEQANDNPNSNLKSLEKAMLYYFDGKNPLTRRLPVGPFEALVDRGWTRYFRVRGQPVAIPSIRIARKDSIFAELRFQNAPGIVMRLASLCKIDDLVISADKFSHFFGGGHKYLELYRNAGLHAALKMGTASEKGPWGLAGNGIFSYGDLAANYSGLLFWNNLTHPRSGYFTIKNGRWIQTRRFTWRQHVTAAWDEAINPPVGPNWQRIQGRISHLVMSHTIPSTPPLDQHKAATIRAHYGPTISPWIVNPALSHDIALGPAESSEITAGTVIWSKCVNPTSGCRVRGEQLHGLCDPSGRRLNTTDQRTTGIGW